MDAGGSILRALLLLLASCTCRPGEVSRLADAEVEVTPSPLVLPEAWVGGTTSAQVTIGNRGGVTALVELWIDGPFATSEGQLELVRGERRLVTVSFSPPAAGSWDGVLHVGDLVVPVSGAGKAPPECAATECQTSVGRIKAILADQAPLARRFRG